jgi:hypothetical protein
MRSPNRIFSHRNRPNFLNSCQLRIVLTLLPAVRIIEPGISHRDLQPVTQQFASLLDIGPHLILPVDPQEVFADDLWCGRGDLNPHASRRHPLKMVCLPIPPLPHKNWLRSRVTMGFVGERKLHDYNKRCGRHRPVGRGRSVLDDGGEGFGVEAGSADESAVDFLFGH